MRISTWTGNRGTAWRAAAGLLLAVSTTLGQSPSDGAGKDADNPTEDLFAVEVSPETRSDIRQLVPLLDSPVYEKRENATKRLMEYGAQAFPALRDAYATTDSLEVRLRIEDIVYEAFLAHNVFDRNAFLGISQDPIARTHDDDPRITEGYFGVRVARLIDGTAAKKSGIRQGDLIIAVDGEPMKASGMSVASAFGESIRVRGPGTEITLTILRGPKKFDKDVILGRRPKQFYGRNQAVVHDMLNDARERFAPWWVRHFHDHGKSLLESDKR